MAPRCLRTPLQTERAVDRISGFLRRHALLFYGALAAVVVLFELRNHVPSGLAPSTTFFVHIFDGVFLAHYFVEAFLWKFGNPHYRAALSPLYFGPGRRRHRAASATAPGLLPVEPEAAAAAARGVPECRAGRLRRSHPHRCLARLSSRRAPRWCSRRSGSIRRASRSATASGRRAWCCRRSWPAWGSATGRCARYGDRLRAAAGAYAGSSSRSPPRASPSSTCCRRSARASRRARRARGAARAARTPLRLGVGVRAAAACPSTAMGMTLPLLVRAAARAGTRTSGACSACSTARTPPARCSACSASSGCCCRRSASAAAPGSAGGLNLLAAAALCSLAAPRAARTPAPARGAASAAPAWRGRASRVARGRVRLGGFALLALEVVWLRFVLLFLNDTPLAFAVILALVLAGDRAGRLARVALVRALSRRARRTRARWSRTPPALSASLGYLLYPWVLQALLPPEQRRSRGRARCAADAARVVRVGRCCSRCSAPAYAGARRTRTRPAGSRLPTRSARAWLAFAGFVLLPRARHGALAVRAVRALRRDRAVLGAAARARARGWRYGGLAAARWRARFFPFGDDARRATSGRRRRAGCRRATDSREVREGLTGTLVHVVHGVHGAAALRSARDQRLLDVGQRLRRPPLHEAVRAAAAGDPAAHRARAGHRLRHRQHRRGADRQPRAQRIDVVDISRDMLALSRCDATPLATCTRSTTRACACTSRTVATSCRRPRSATT